MSGYTRADGYAMYNARNNSNHKDHDKYFRQDEKSGQYVLRDGYEQRYLGSGDYVNSAGAESTFSNDYDDMWDSYEPNRDKKVYGIYGKAREGEQAQEAPAAPATPTPQPERDPAVVEQELAELNTGRDRYDNTRLDRPENNQPRYGFSDDPYRDAISHGDDLNAHYQNHFLPSLRAEAEQTSREIGFSGRNALNDFVGKVPQLGDPKDLFAYYSDKLNQSA